MAQLEVRLHMDRLKRSLLQIVFFNRQRILENFIRSSFIRFAKLFLPECEILLELSTTYSLFPYSLLNYVMRVLETEMQQTQRD